MSHFYTYVGTDVKDYHVDVIILDDGREIVLGVPIELSEDEVSGLRKRHYVFEKSSEQEAEAVESAIADWLEDQPEVGEDLRGTAPRLGGGFLSKKSAKSGKDHPKEVKLSYDRLSSD